MALLLSLGLSLPGPAHALRGTAAAQSGTEELLAQALGRGAVTQAVASPDAAGNEELAEKYPLWELFSGKELSDYTGLTKRYNEFFTAAGAIDREPDRDKKLQMLRALEKEWGEKRKQLDNVLFLSFLFNTYRQLTSFEDAKRFYETYSGNDPLFRASNAIYADYLLALNRLGDEWDGEVFLEANRRISELEQRLAGQGEKGTEDKLSQTMLSELLIGLATFQKNRFAASYDLSGDRNVAALSEARHLYERAFRADRGYYGGVNWMRTLLYEDTAASWKEARRLARLVRVSALQADYAKSFWEKATLLEIALLEGDRKETVKQLLEVLQSALEPYEIPSLVEHLRRWATLKSTGSGLSHLLRGTASLLEVLSKAQVPVDLNKILVDLESRADIPPEVNGLAAELLAEAEGERNRRQSLEALVERGGFRLGLYRRAITLPNNARFRRGGIVADVRRDLVDATLTRQLAARLGLVGEMDSDRVNRVLDEFMEKQFELRNLLTGLRDFEDLKSPRHQWWIDDFLAKFLDRIGTRETGLSSISLMQAVALGVGDCRFTNYAKQALTEEAASYGIDLAMMSALELMGKLQPALYSRKIDEIERMLKERPEVMVMQVAVNGNIKLKRDAEGKKQMYELEKTADGAFLYDPESSDVEEHTLMVQVVRDGAGRIRKLVLMDTWYHGEDGLIYNFKGKEIPREDLEKIGTEGFLVRDALKVFDPAAGRLRSIDVRLKPMPYSVQRHIPSPRRLPADLSGLATDPVNPADLSYFALPGNEQQFAQRRLELVKRFMEPVVGTPSKWHAEKVAAGAEEGFPEPVEWQRHPVAMRSQQTYLNRDLGQEAWLKEEILPDIARRNASSRTITLAFLGVSTGEEVARFWHWTREWMAENGLSTEGPAPWQLQLIGVANDPAILAHARARFSGDSPFVYYFSPYIRTEEQKQGVIRLAREIVRTVEQDRALLAGGAVAWLEGDMAVPAVIRQVVGSDLIVSNRGSIYLRDPAKPGQAREMWAALRGGKAWILTDDERLSHTQEPGNWTVQTRRGEWLPLDGMDTPDFRNYYVSPPRQSGAEEVPVRLPPPSAGAAEILPYLEKLESLAEDERLRSALSRTAPAVVSYVGMHRLHGVLIPALWVLTEYAEHEIGWAELARAVPHLVEIVKGEKYYSGGEKAAAWEALAVMAQNGTWLPALVSEGFQPAREIAEAGISLEGFSAFKPAWRALRSHPLYPGLSYERKSALRWTLIQNAALEPQDRLLRGIEPMMLHYARMNGVLKAVPKEWTVYELDAGTDGISRVPVESGAPDQVVLRKPFRDYLRSETLEELDANYHRALDSFVEAALQVKESEVLDLELYEQRQRLIKFMRAMEASGRLAAEILRTEDQTQLRLLAFLDEIDPGMGRDVRAALGSNNDAAGAEEGIRVLDLEQMAALGDRQAAKLAVQAGKSRNNHVVLVPARLLTSSVKEEEKVVTLLAHEEVAGAATAVLPLEWTVRLAQEYIPADIQSGSRFLSRMTKELQNVSNLFVAVNSKYQRHLDALLPKDHPVTLMISPEWGRVFFSDQNEEAYRRALAYILSQPPELLKNLVLELSYGSVRRVEIQGEDYIAIFA